MDPLIALLRHAEYLTMAVEHIQSEMCKVDDIKRSLDRLERALNTQLIAGYFSYLSIGLYRCNTGLYRVNVLLFAIRVCRLRAGFLYYFST